MQQNWSRSRTSQRTRSSSEKSSNTVILSRYSPSLQQTLVASDCPESRALFLFACLPKLCYFHPMPDTSGSAIKPSFENFARGDFGFSGNSTPVFWDELNKETILTADVKCIQGSHHCFVASKKFTSSISSLLGSTYNKQFSPCLLN